MPHISVEIPAVSKERKHELIKTFRKVLSDIAGIDIESISVSIHELPEENMNCCVSPASLPDKKSKPARSEKDGRKKSFFREIFPE